MKLTRSLANKYVRDSRPVWVQWRVHWSRCWPVALSHARMSIEGRDKGFLPSRVKWIRTLWLPGPGWPPPLTARVGQ
eukprot:3007975-Pyramimonas_sp.AAC.1